MKKLLVVVDYQNDFVSGALGFSGAESLEEGILHAVESTLAAGGFVLFTRDTHDEAYLDTREGKYLPVLHCVKGTPGHSLYGQLHKYEVQQHERTCVIDKPTFGSPDIKQQAEQLCGGAPDEIDVCGLVTDICVVSNAILLHTAFPHADVRVLENLSATGNRENGEKSLDVLRGLGIAVKKRSM